MPSPFSSLSLPFLNFTTLTSWRTFTCTAICTEWDASQPSSFCYQVVHQHLSCPWLEVIPLKYQEMGGGGKRAGSISWSRVMADVTLPLPPVQDSYSSREHGWRGRHTSLSTNMGSIFQQPSNFLIKPVRPCLNLTCKRHCTKTRIRQHITCVDQRDWQCFKVLQYDFFCSGQKKHELTRRQTTRGISSCCQLHFNYLPWPFLKQDFSWYYFLKTKHYPCHDTCL